ncbi:putative quinol monooxygenase [Streptomyces sp. NPDC001070]
MSGPTSDIPANIWPLADARTGRIVAIARWTPAPGTRDTIRAALPDPVCASRAEPGCLNCQTCQPDGTDEGDIVLVERYADRAALDAHRGSAHFRSLALERIVPLPADRHAVVTTVA